MYVIAIFRVTSSIAINVPTRSSLGLKTVGSFVSDVGTFE